MFSFLKRSIYTLSNRVRYGSTETHKDKLTVNFSRTKNCPFDIKSESSYNANLSGNSLELGLKKSNCIAWTDIPDYKFQDHVIDAKIRLDSLGGYAAAGVLFRIADEETYYMALVSGKGYFRLDAVKNNSPKPLIAWSEISDFDGENFNMKIITYGSFLIFVVNGKWLGEVTDDTIASGRIGFALASYDTNEQENEYSCKAYLENFSADARTRAVEDGFKKWTDDNNINADSRLKLAETFAVMGESEKALAQIIRAWDRRDEAISAVSTSYTKVRTKKELLLAARMSFRLGQFGEAQEYFDAILDQWPTSAEAKSARIEKLKVLTELNKYAELKDFMLKDKKEFDKDIDYYALLAKCHWELKEYKDSAKAWEKAFKMNGENGVYAANAASAHEMTDNREKALLFFLEAGRIFLKEDNMAELAVVAPKLAVLGEKDWEARVLSGKWAFSIEDYDKALAEFTAANKLRCALKPRPKEDPAHYYLWGLVLNMKSKKSEAVRLLEKAVRLAPDYGLFRFKLAEFKLTAGVKDKNPADEFKLALDQIGDDTDGELANRAGTLLQNAGYAKAAKYFFERAKA